MRIAYIVEPRKIIGGGVRAAINLAKAMNEYYDENTIILGHTSVQLKMRMCNLNLSNH